MDLDGSVFPSRIGGCSRLRCLVWISWSCSCRRWRPRRRYSCTKPFSSSQQLQGLISTLSSSLMYRSCSGDRKQPHLHQQHFLLLSGSLHPPLHHQCLVAGDLNMLICLPLTSSSVGVERQSHDALLAEVVRLEAALHDVRQEVEGLSVCRDGCRRLDRIQQTVRWN